MGLPTGVFQFPLALGHQFPALFLGAFQSMFSVVPGFFCLSLSFLQLQFQIIQLGQHTVQPLVIIGHMVPGRVDDLLGYPQLGTNEERIGFTRHTHTELVGRHQGLHIELAAGVDHAGSLQRIHLQFCIVGGSHQQTALPAQLFQNTHRQRRAFCRISTGTQFVDQRKRAMPGALQNPADALHVTGESGKALLNALLVADIHQIFPEMADHTALMGGNQKSVLGHSVEQPCRFDRHCLAAGVGTSDHQGIIFLAQGDVHRHHALFVDERMPRPVEPEANLVTDSRPKGILFRRQPRFGQQQVDLQHGLVAVRELGFQRADLCRERTENTGDLLLLLGAQLHDARVGFHHCRGLHKNGGTGGGNVMNDAPYLAAVLGAHRHHVAPVAQRHHRVLQELVGGGVFDDIVQLGADGIFCLAYLAAQVMQCHAGSVGHFFRREDAVRDLFFQRGLGCQSVEQVVGGQHLVFAQAVPLGQAREIAQRGGNFQQFPHGEDAALLGMGRNTPCTGHTAEPRTAVFEQQRIDRVGLGQGIALFLRRGTRLQGLHQFFGFPAGAQLHGAGQNFIQFQRCLVGGIHRGYCFSLFQYSF